MEPSISNPKMNTLTALAYFNELCAKSSGPIKSHEWPNFKEFTSPVRKCDVLWKGELIVTLKDGQTMTFSAQVSRKQELRQELARLFLEKAGLTTPSKSYGEDNYGNRLLIQCFNIEITPKSPKRQVLNLCKHSKLHNLQKILTTVQITCFYPPT